MCIRDRGNSNPYSLKHFKNYFTAITGYTTTGFTPTYADGKMRFTGGGGNFSQYLTINGLKNSDENLEIEVIFKVIVSGFGVGIGKRSINTWYNASTVLTCSPTQSSFYLWDSNAVSIINSKAVATTAVNDIIKIKFTQLANVITCTYYNLTTGVTSQFVSTGNLSTTKNFKIPNSSDLVVHNLGGTNDIISIKVTSFSNYKPDILVIGDSKSVGYSAKNNSLRWANNIGSLGTVIVNAGDGDRTVEATQTIDYTKLIKAKYAILAIGRNDLNSGVASGTWQTNYVNIVTQLQGQGTTVFHLLPVPETVQTDQSALNTWIIATYGAGNCIDIATGWSNGTMLSSDNVHPNEVGHAFIAKKIIDSGLISTTLPVQVFNKNNEVDQIQSGIATPNLNDVLTAGNTATRLNVDGLIVNINDTESEGYNAIFGGADSNGNGVRGLASYGYGVVGTATSGTGVFALSGTGVALFAEATSGTDIARFSQLSSTKVIIKGNGRVSGSNAVDSNEFVTKGQTAVTDGTASAVSNIWSGTQAQYDAIGTKLATTIYFIQ
jgi:lysophospholipase L1-like esterase